ncbi:glutathione transferase GstA [Xanthomonas rydalmerensis]|uniref:Glutathione transferase GstA n=1 Tax=Xanthomonas rydalmerensis TaxID=3046274 RepID=A0ABZ0JLW5_9XANT|nr:glutathione transferase GstA [Xanthomonas sp. DM-2023]WOS40005.1 glutathione transferase GstA [Xanthomonas sp. DM-2023]WOS44189.1 glutathione transferase GstA [Xanthomonas sp. DM-2023]WOS48369.1 glutathione transferase GstA [Xanthomonas sp. DM-2023]WOS52549.1 glutathione transferase GstA [Xanthomonas sp. DM-2023]WOS56733.1 glutathione transferase GstA [Xanthomonas sp. DM-2023]
MHLYAAPGACSLAPHIVLRELQLPFRLVRVDNRSKRTAEGEDFRAINPKGYVAALQLDDGQVLTEGPAILLYLADRCPQAALVPPAEAGALPRYRLYEWLAFINSELHAGSVPLFDAGLAPERRAAVAARLLQRYGHAETALSARAYLLGERFGVADAYLFTVLGWLPRFGLSLDAHPALAAYTARIAQRPSVVAALAAEQALAPS